MLDLLLVLACLTLLVYATARTLVAAACLVLALLLAAGRFIRWSW